MVCSSHGRFELDGKCRERACPLFEGKTLLVRKKWKQLFLKVGIRPKCETRLFLPPFQACSLRASLKASDKNDVCRRYLFRECTISKHSTILFSHARCSKGPLGGCKSSNLFVRPLQLGLEWFLGFLIVVAFVLSRMMMLLRDLHNDHLGRTVTETLPVHQNQR